MKNTSNIPILNSDIKITDVTKTIIDNNLSSIIFFDPVTLDNNIELKKMFITDTEKVSFKKDDTTTINILDNGLVNTTIPTDAHLNSKTEKCPICGGKLFSLFDTIKTCISLDCLSDPMKFIFSYLNFFVNKDLLHITLKEYTAINLLIKRNIYTLPIAIFQLDVSDFVCTSLNKSESQILLNKLSSLIGRLSFYEYTYICMLKFFSSFQLNKNYAMFFDMYLSHSFDTYINTDICVNNYDDIVFHQYATILNYPQNKQHIKQAYVYRLFQ